MLKNSRNIRCFNPRPHAEGDEVFIVVSVVEVEFQSTPSRGGRHIYIERENAPPSFNPRPHAEGDYIYSTTTFKKKLFQSTPSRGGRPHLLFFCSQNFFVSIHALTRRATRRCKFCYARKFVSIHALTRRATRRFPRAMARELVSIHALTRRATARLLKYLSPTRSFNPRPHAEGDLLRVLQPFPTLQFQSTPSRGGRLTKLIAQLKELQVSIHALTRRATKR